MIYKILIADVIICRNTYPFMVNKELNNIRFRFQLYNFLVCAIFFNYYKLYYSFNLFNGNYLVKMKTYFQEVKNSELRLQE